jgi:hypothetical protein
MSLRYRLSEAARELKRLEQGDLDALCGLYAIINAVRISLYPRHKLRPRELRRLFEAGLTSLSRSRRLRAVVTDGMRLHVWSNLCDAVLAEASQIVGGAFLRRDILVGEDRLSERDGVRCIKRSLRDGAPVLVALMGSYNHFSVIASFSATRFNLFDSRNRKWVWIRSVSFEPAAANSPHFIPPPSVIAISVSSASSDASEASVEHHVGEGRAESPSDPDEV